MSVKCSVCGQELPDGTKFCSECGAKITVLTCPKCGEILPENTKYCMFRGAAVNPPFAEHPEFPNETEDPEKNASSTETPENTIHDDEPISIPPENEPEKNCISPDTTGKNESSSSIFGKSSEQQQNKPLEAVIGKNAAYYMEEFRKIDRGEATRFNWAAFFFGPFFCLYRGSWDLAKKYFLFPVVIQVVVFSLGLAVYDNPLSFLLFIPDVITALLVVAALALIASVWGLISCIRLGKSFNKEYYQICKASSIAQPTSVRDVNAQRLQKSPKNLETATSQHNNSTKEAHISVKDILKTIGSLSLIVLVAYFIFFYNRKDIKMVQRGHLGEYTDVTVKELFDKFYNAMDCKKGKWTSKKIIDRSDAGAETSVEVRYHYPELNQDAVIVFFSKDDEYFKITDFTDPYYELQTDADILGFLNCMYWFYHDGDESVEFLSMLDAYPANAVQYGLSKNSSNTIDNCCTEFKSELFDPNDCSALWLLGEMDVIDTDQYYFNSLPSNYKVAQKCLDKMYEESIQNGYLENSFSYNCENNNTTAEMTVEQYYIIGEGYKDFLDITIHDSLAGTISFNHIPESDNFTMSGHSESTYSLTPYFSDYSGRIVILQEYGYDYEYMYEYADISALIDIKGLYGSNGQYEYVW